jgi:ketosteroid isomerase-like protein
VTGSPLLDLVRGSYEAFERGDLEGALAHIDPDVEWHQAEGLPHGGVYRGLVEVRRNVFDPLDRDWWSEFSAEPEELVGAGETVLVLGRYRGVARGTGRTLDVPFAHVWTFRGTRAIRFRQFLDTAGWNAALAP